MVGPLFRPISVIGGGDEEVTPCAVPDGALTHVYFDDQWTMAGPAQW